MPEPVFFSFDANVALAMLLFSLIYAKKSRLAGCVTVRNHAGMQDTVFHKILRKEIPATVEYEDADVLVFRDIHPKAHTHLLFVPKVFIASIADVTPETAHIPGLLILKAQKFAKEKGIDGYKLTFHVGRGGGQEVMYLHLHFLSDQLDA